MQHYANMLRVIYLCRIMQTCWESYISMQNYANRLRELYIYTALWKHVERVIYISEGLCKHAERIIYLSRIMQTCWKIYIMSELEREYRSLCKKRWKLFCMYLVVRSQPKLFQSYFRDKRPGFDSRQYQMSFQFFKIALFQN